MCCVTLGACVNAIKSLNTPLHEAARRQDVSLILLLLACGADVTARNNNGLRPDELVLSSTHPAKRVLIQWQSMCFSPPPPIVKRYCTSCRVKVIVPPFLLKMQNESCYSGIVGNFPPPIKEVMIQWQSNCDPYHPSPPPKKKNK